MLGELNSESQFEELQGDELQENQVEAELEGTIEEERHNEKPKTTAKERIGQLYGEKKRAERERDEFKNRLGSLELEFKKIRLEKEAEELESLKGEFALAFQEGDAEKALELQSKIIQKNVQPAQPQNENYTSESDVAMFKQKNPWYGVNRNMSIDADAEAQKLSEDPAWQYEPVSKRLEEVSRRVLARYKNNTPSITDGVSNISSSQKKSVGVTESEIREIYRMFGIKDKKEAMKMAIELKNNIVI